MANSLTYGGIITKIKAMSGRLITKKEFEHLVELETTADFINYLRLKPSYENIFKDMNETTIHRGQIEEMIKISLYMDFSSLYIFATREQRVFLNIFFLRYEVNILKECLELLYNHKSTLHLASFSSFFEKHSELDIDGLSSCQSIEDYSHMLIGTKFECVLSNLHNTDQNISLSEFECQLDIFYYQHIWKLIKKNFRGKEKKRMLTLFGTEIDMQNITWIYRFKKFYRVEPKDIYASIIPIHYHLMKEQVIKLVESPSLIEFSQALSSTHYGFIKGSADTLDLETIYSQVMKKTYKNILRSSSHSMIHILYYLFLKEEELDCVTTALECVRYNLEPTQSMKYIYSI